MLAVIEMKRVEPATKMMVHKRIPASIEQGSLTSLTPKRQKAGLSMSSKEDVINWIINMEMDLICTPAFGATGSGFSFASSPAFGQSAYAFGCSPTPFGVTSIPASPFSSSPFGAQNSPFGARATTPAFGGKVFEPPIGSRVYSYDQTPEADSGSGTLPVAKLESISAMPAYKEKINQSFEQMFTNLFGALQAMRQMSTTECDMLSFIRSLKSMVRTSNAVAFLTFPASLVSSSVSKRWQHMADTLLSIKAIPDEDKELASLLTGYQDMLGLLSVQKVARFNTQVEVHVKNGC